MFFDPGELESDGLTNHELIHLHRLEILASAFPWSLRVFTAIHCLIGLVQMALLIVLIVALVQDWDKPCSQPLHIWVVIDLSQNSYQVLHGIAFNVLRCGSTSRWAKRYDKISLTTIALFSCAWDVVGAYWVFDSDGCENTAPRLHAAVKAYIIFALVLTVFMIINAVGLYTLLTRLAEFDFIEVDGAAPPGTLERLRVVEFDECASEFRDSPECCICMADFAPGSEIRAAPCGHLFHGRCLGNWLKINRTCPLCRGDVVRELESPEAGGGLATTIGRGVAPDAAGGGAEAPRLPSDVRELESPEAGGGLATTLATALATTLATIGGGAEAAAASSSPTASTVGQSPPCEPPEALADGAGPRLPGESPTPPEAV